MELGTEEDEEVGEGGEARNVNKPNSTAMSSAHDMTIFPSGPVGIAGWFGVNVQASQLASETRPIPCPDASTNM